MLFQNAVGVKSNAPSLNNSSQQSQQQISPPQQQVLQKPSQPTQITRTVAYPQASTVFQSVPSQPTTTAQPQLTSQKIQAVRQHQQAFQSVSGTQSGSQPGYQSPQVVLQQPSLPSVPPGSTIQTGHQPFQQHLPHPSSISQPAPAVASAAQSQHTPTTQSIANPSLSLGSQGATRTQLAQLSATTAGSTQLSMHTQSTLQPAAVASSVGNAQPSHLISNKNAEAKAPQT